MNAQVSVKERNNTLLFLCVRSIPKGSQAEPIRREGEALYSTLYLVLEIRMKVEKEE